MNRNQEEFEKAMKALLERVEELRGVEVLAGFGKILDGMARKGVASLIDDYLWGD